MKLSEYITFSLATQALFDANKTAVFDNFFPIDDVLKGLTEKQNDFINLLLNPDPSIANSDLEALYEGYEYKILTSTLSVEDKKIPLLAAAVGKYSSAYWYAQITNPASPWLGWMGSNPPAGMPNWLKGDISGGVGGGVTGALYSWWTGGGVVVGASIGAVSGAIGGSISALF